MVNDTTSLNFKAADTETPPSLSCPTADEDTAVLIVELNLLVASRLTD